MLRFLSVRQLAVIERLEVDFDPGLNIITGETGAGKSVLVEAISLLVGGRASADLVRTGEDLAIIQAVFDKPDGHEAIVRREISSQGRSRAFIDDTLATTAGLRELGASLVSLHGQHEHQALLDPSEHLGLLDVFIADGAQVAAVAAAFEEWRRASTALDRTRMDDREKRARIEIASFQLQEIDKVAPRDREDESLAEERLVLHNADRLTRLSTEAYGALYEGDAPALGTLAGVWKRLADLAAVDARFAPYLEQRDAVKSSLEDLAFFLREYAAGLDNAPDRLQAVEDRLASIERVKRRYGPTLADVLEQQQHLREELAALGAGDEQVGKLQAAEQNARERFLTLARQLSTTRQAAAQRLGRSLEAALADLAMPEARVDIRVRPADRPETWTSSGVDEVEFYLSPNPGEEVRPLARIASGGELSRIMLALRTLAAPKEPGRTLIFDEVDAGIGGAAADAVGARLQTLARRSQVLCITHLPQIAARAGAHFQIAKEVRGGRTATRLTRLDTSGRELEVARMISGMEVTPQVLASARDLLTTRQDSEAKAKGESETAGRAKAKGRRSGA
jgi:DNA repair protein RecN (Recombination protein N)